MTKRSGCCAAPSRRTRVRPTPHEKLGRALWDLGVYDRGLQHFHEALRLRPSPASQVAAATLVPPIYTSIEQVQTRRDRLIREVDRLREAGVTIDITNHVARTPFYLPYAGLPDRDVMREIAKLHRPPPDVPLPPRAGEKVRVAFISTLFKDQTVGLWTQGLIAKLPRDRFEVLVLSAGRHGDATAQFIRAAADQYVELPATLPSRARRFATSTSTCCSTPIWGWKASRGRSPSRAWPVCRRPCGAIQSPAAWRRSITSSPAISPRPRVPRRITRKS